MTLKSALPKGDYSGVRYRTKLMLLVLLAGLLPTLTMGQLGYFALRKQVHDSTSTLLQAVAQANAHQVALWLGEQKSTALAVARSADLLRGWAERDQVPRGSEEDFKALYRLKQVVALCNQSSRWFNEVRLADLNGDIFLADNSRESHGPLLPEEARFNPQQLLVDGDARYTPVFWNRTPAPRNIDSYEFSEGFPSMFFVAPVRGEGAPVGLLACRVALADLGSLFPREASQVSLDVLLVRRDGLLVSSNRELSGAGFQQNIPVADVGSAFPGSGYSLSGYPDYSGRQVVGAWEPVLGTDLAIVVQIHREQLTSTLNAAVGLMVSLSLGLCIACSALAFLAAERLLAPLKVLTNAAHRLEQGDRSIRVRLSRGDEIGELGDTFDQMAATLEATVQALETARDEALAAYRAKGRFLANMTHELRTPLNAIIGYSEMLIGEVGDLGQVQWVEDLGVIRRSGKELLLLIDSILDLSKLEAGKMHLDVEEFALSDLLQEVELVMRPLVRERDNAFTRVYTGEDLVVQDRLKLKQILLNLLSNANKFTERGEVELGAEIEGAQLRLWVRDTGVGMTAAQCRRVFEEFVQADESITRKFGGTGLGLTLVRRFCEMLGGRVSVESELKVGTTVTVVLPTRWSESESR